MRATTVDVFSRNFVAVQCLDVDAHGPGLGHLRGRANVDRSGLLGRLAHIGAARSRGRDPRFFSVQRRARGAAQRQRRQPLPLPRARGVRRRKWRCRSALSQVCANGTSADTVRGRCQRVPRRHERFGAPVPGRGHVHEPQTRWWQRRSRSSSGPAASSSFLCRRWALRALQLSVRRVGAST